MERSERTSAAPDRVRRTGSAELGRNRGRGLFQNDLYEENKHSSTNYILHDGIVTLFTEPVCPVRGLRTCEGGTSRTMRPRTGDSGKQRK